jgi:TRAP-type C4-dicarboxylate transport system substrate-binding protein
MIDRRYYAGAVAAAVAASVAMSASAAEKTLKSVTSLQQTNVLTKSFRAKFEAPLNQSAKGVLQVKYLGGQEIVPPRKAVTALRRGQFDILHSPTAYYIGTVPEGYGLLASNQGPRVLRTNGGWELLQKIYLEKAGAHLLAWGENMTSYNMYLSKRPKLDADGVPDLTGMKMRATGTYRPLFRALGATTINIKSSEIFTAVQRGTVDGFGFTDVSAAALGFHKIVKFRIQPNFYQTNTVVTVNPASWGKLTRQQQDVMNRMAIEYEITSLAYVEAVRREEDKEFVKAGVEEIVLSPSAGAKYLEIAHGEIWKELKKRSKYHDQLRPLLYIPGKPNRQTDLGRSLDEKR